MNARKDAGYPAEYQDRNNIRISGKISGQIPDNWQNITTRYRIANRILGRIPEMKRPDIRSVPIHKFADFFFRFPLQKWVHVIVSVANQYVVDVSDLSLMKGQTLLTKVYEKRLIIFI